jgi:hypothetical protein
MPQWERQWLSEEQFEAARGAIASGRAAMSLPLLIEVIHNQDPAWDQYDGFAEWRDHWIATWVEVADPGWLFLVRDLLHHTSLNESTWSDRLWLFTYELACGFPEEAAKVLGELLRSEGDGAGQSDLSIFVLGILGNIGSEAALPYLTALAQSRGVSWRVLAALRSALLAIGSPAARQVIAHLPSATQSPT